MPLRSGLPDGQLSLSETHTKALQERHIRVFDSFGEGCYMHAIQRLWEGYENAVQPDTEHHPLCRSCPEETVCLLDAKSRCEIRTEMQLFHNQDTGVVLRARLTLYPTVVDTGAFREGEAPAWTYLEMAKLLEQAMKARIEGEYRWMSS